MQSWNQLISGYIRACRWCGSLSGFTDLFCGICWGKLEALVFESESAENESYSFLANTLFDWKMSERQTLKSELLVSLKGGEFSWVNQRLAELFFQKNQFETSHREECCVVPAPAKKVSDKDHGYYLAEAIAEYLCVPLVPCLDRVTSDSQKKKNLQGRKQQKMRLRREFQQKSYSRSNVIFVDDIIASGSTVEAAYKTLNSPKKFQVFALAHRPKLAAKRGF